MKVKETTIPKKEFKPFTIELTFESEDEVREMWHRTNIVIHHVLDLSDSKTYPTQCFSAGVKLWVFLNDKLNSL